MFRLEDFVDIEDLTRKRAIRESEYQQQADADSHILRVSGKVPQPVKRITAPTSRERNP